MGELESKGQFLGLLEPWLLPGSFETKLLSGPGRKKAGMSQQWPAAEQPTDRAGSVKTGSADGQGGGEALQISLQRLGGGGARGEFETQPGGHCMERPPRTCIWR